MSATAAAAAAPASTFAYPELLPSSLAAKTLLRGSLDQNILKAAQRIERDAPRLNLRTAEALGSLRVFIEVIRPNLSAGELKLLPQVEKCMRSAAAILGTAEADQKEVAGSVEPEQKSAAGAAPSASPPAPVVRSLPICELVFTNLDVVDAAANAAANYAQASKGFERISKPSNISFTVSAACKLDEHDLQALSKEPKGSYLIYQFEKEEEIRELKYYIVFFIDENGKIQWLPILQNLQDQSGFRLNVPVGHFGTQYSMKNGMIVEHTAGFMRYKTFTTLADIKDVIPCLTRRLNAD